MLEQHPDLKDHPFFLYMVRNHGHSLHCFIQYSYAQPSASLQAFQNNHSPYTEVEQYTARYPEIPAGSMKRVYNSNMAAVDDAIGVMRETLAEQDEKFGNKTLIVFSQVLPIAMHSWFLCFSLFALLTA